LEFIVFKKLKGDIKMKQIIKNPLTVWFTRLIKSKITEYKNRKKNF